VLVIDIHKQQEVKKFNKVSNKSNNKVFASNFLMFFPAAKLYIAANETKAPGTVTVHSDYLDTSRLYSS